MQKPRLTSNLLHIRNWHYVSNRKMEHLPAKFPDEIKQDVINPFHANVSLSLDSLTFT